MMVITKDVSQAACYHSVFLDEEEGNPSLSLERLGYGMSVWCKISSMLHGLRAELCMARLSYEPKVWVMLQVVTQVV